MASPIFRVVIKSALFNEKRHNVVQQHGHNLNEVEAHLAEIYVDMAVSGRLADQ
jgi:hypothetical protein